MNNKDKPYSLFRESIPAELREEYKRELDMTKKELEQQCKEHELYNIVKDKVRFNGKLCGKFDCRRYRDFLETCTLFERPLWPENKSDMPVVNFLRCQQCIDIFGGE